MLAYARLQLESSVENAAYMLKLSEDLSASELLLVEDFDAQHLSTTQNELLAHMGHHHELLHYMQGGYSTDISDIDNSKKMTFEQCAKDLRENRRIKAIGLKQHQADVARDLIKFRKN